MTFFTGKTIIVLSPQPWKSLYISKQHYARVLAENNKVYFISAPGHGLESTEISQPEDGVNLFVIKTNLNLPLRLKFYLPALYRYFVRHRFMRIFKNIVGKIDVCIDFGCYQQYRSMNWIQSDYKIFFPVDDNYQLQPDSRGADLVLSVSKNICEKFERAGQGCYFINHGLSAEFAEQAEKYLDEGCVYKKNEKIKIAYSGNLFIPFLDIPIVRKIVFEHPEVEFHFFGGTTYNKAVKLHSEWERFLRESPNVYIHGILNPGELAAAYQKVDGFLLCYKPDYKNYHAENSHKVFEYLSTGKVLVTTYLSIYEGNSLMAMSAKDKNEDVPRIFDLCLSQIESLNNPALQRQRILLALDNTYKRQLERIDTLVCNEMKLKHSGMPRKTVNEKNLLN